MNCWEFRKCGRETGGFRSRELGVCPVYPDHGTHCAKVETSLCGRKEDMVGTMIGCLICDFYSSEYYDKQYGTWIIGNENGNDNSGSS